MILSGIQITNKVASGEITINPFNEKFVNPNSYNYRISKELFEVTDKVIDPKQTSSMMKINFTDKGYVLKPGKLYLASTEERIGSNKFVTSLIGRSSLGRLGVFVQITADLGNLGAIHKWTLELTVVQKVRIYPNMCIGQVSFWTSTGENAIQYEGKYHSHNGPYQSKFYKELGSGE